MIEELEKREPFQFLNGACEIKPGKTLFLAPEFHPQMVNIAAGIAGGRKNPCPFINTYGSEEVLLPKYVSDTIKIMVDNRWINSIVTLGFTEMALKHLNEELKDAKVDVSLIRDAFKIKGYVYDSLVDWAIDHLNKFYGEAPQMILAYDEPLSAFLSAKLKAPIMPLDDQMDKLPRKYIKAINNFEVKKLIFVAHGKYIEESWKTHRIIQELNSIHDVEAVVIYGDLFHLSKSINETVFGPNGCVNKICFVSGVNEISILTPLAIETGAIILRCGYDNFNSHFKSLFKIWKVKKAVITEEPDKLSGEDLDTWFYISTRTRYAIESILSPLDVYRLWFSQPKKVIFELMKKYDSLDTMAHVLFWGIERKIMETMFKISEH